jgi:hypothetical protein
VGGLTLTDWLLDEEGSRTRKVADVPNVMEQTHILLFCRIDAIM